MSDRKLWAWLALVMGACEAPTPADVADEAAEQDAEELQGTSAALAAKEPALPGPDVGEWAEYMGNDGSGWVGFSRAVEKRVHKTSKAEFDSIERERAALGFGKEKGPQAAPVEHDPTEHALAKARSADPDLPITVSLELAEPEFGFHAFRQADARRRDELVGARRKQLSVSQDAVAAELEKLGGKVTGSTWIVNSLFAEVPARSFPALAKIPGVARLSVADESPKDEWDGDNLRPGMQLDRAELWDGRHDFYTGCFTSPQDPGSCHDGRTGNRTDTSQPVRIAIIEFGLFNHQHVGWRDTGATNSPSRIRGMYKCTTGGCTDVCTGGVCPAGNDSHGTPVAWVAAGSIEEGQDSAFPGTRTDQQIARSGIAKEAQIIYLHISVPAGDPTADAQARVKAIERAVAEGADVINMSWGLKQCHEVDTKTYDIASMNGALRAAINAGALPVKSAGNNGHVDKPCNITYPAWRPEVLSVGALNSRSNELTDINDLGLLNNDFGQATSRGGATLHHAGGSDRTFSGVDLMAPGCVENTFSNSFNAGAAPWGYLEGGVACGTSIASPIVAASAALLRDALFTLGWSEAAADARQLLNNMILFGDHWDPEQPSGPQRISGMSNVSGAGRLHMRYPGLTNLVWPAGWWSQKIHVNQGQTVEWDVWFPWAEPVETNLWKWAVTWFDADLNNASDIVIQVIDRCNRNQSYGSDFSFDFRKKVWLPWYLVANRCLVMRATALKTPAGGTDIFTADYFHSGSVEGSYSEHMAGLPE